MRLGGHGAIGIIGQRRLVVLLGCGSLTAEQLQIAKIDKRERIELVGGMIAYEPCELREGGLIITHHERGFTAAELALPGVHAGGIDLQHGIEMRSGVLPLLHLHQRFAAEEVRIGGADEVRIGLDERRKAIRRRLPLALLILIRGSRELCVGVCRDGVGDSTGEQQQDGRNR